MTKGENIMDEEFYNSSDNLINNFSAYKDIDSMFLDENSYFHKLTLREKKGFIFEWEGHKAFRDNNVEYEGNPTDPLLWKKDIAKGYDFRLRVNRREVISAEFKKVDHKIFPCHYYESWKPRFQNIAVYSIHKVFTVSNKENVSDSVKELIKQDGYELMSLEETINLYQTIKIYYNKPIPYYLLNILNILNIILLPFSPNFSSLEHYIPSLTKQKRSDDI